MTMQVAERVVSEAGTMPLQGIRAVVVICSMQRTTASVLLISSLHGTADTSGGLQIDTTGLLAR